MERMILNHRPNFPLSIEFEDIDKAFEDEKVKIILINTIKMVKKLNMEIVAEGVETDVHFNKTPVFFELYFDEETIDSNLMIEFDGHWFYKKPGVKCIDLMPYFFEHSLTGPADFKLRFFATPADGLNHPENNESPDTAAFGDWMNNVYTVLPKLPTIRIEEEPIQLAKAYRD